MNPWTALPAPRGLITGPNLRHQALILLCAPTHRALTPSIEPTPGDVEHPTQYPRWCCVDRLNLPRLFLGYRAPCGVAPLLGARPSVLRSPGSDWIRGARPRLAASSD